jgi:hypothetical protein
VVQRPGPKRRYPIIEAGADPCHRLGDADPIPNACTRSSTALVDTPFTPRQRYRWDSSGGYVAVHTEKSRR